MNTNQLEYFIVLSETLNYSKAAEKLNISQPTLSKAIKHLEEEVGFPLTQKKGRTIELSDQAKVFLPYIKKSLNALNSGLKHVYEEKETMRIGSVLTATTRVPSIIDAIHRQNPNIFISIKNGVSSELIKDLLNHNLDMVICTGTDKYPELMFVPFFKQQLYAVVYKGHKLAKRKFVKVEDFSHERVVAHSKNGSVNNLYSGIFQNVQFNTVASADEDDQIVALVKNKIGIGLIGASNPVNTKEVVFIPLQQDMIERYLSIGYFKDNDKIQKLVNLIVEM